MQKQISDRYLLLQADEAAWPPVIKFSACFQILATFAKYRISYRSDLQCGVY